jgi:2-iminobutanoate/2-iminopropanoate deaminase
VQRRPATAQRRCLEQLERRTDGAVPVDRAAQLVLVAEDPDARRGREQRAAGLPLEPPVQLGRAEQQPRLARMRGPLPERSAVAVRGSVGVGWAVALDRDDPVTVERELPGGGAAPCTEADDDDGGLGAERHGASYRTCDLESEEKESPVTLDHVVPDPARGYSEAVSAAGAGRWIHVAGHVGFAPDGEAVVPGGLGAEADATLDNIERTLAAVGAELRHVVKLTAYLTDLSHYAEYASVRRRRFPAAPPASAAVGVSSLLAGACIEIDAVAFVPDDA